MAKPDEHDRARMSHEQILRWLIEFGTETVHPTKLFDTWADEEVNWFENSCNGMLDQDIKGYKLSDKAIRRLKNEK